MTGALQPVGYKRSGYNRWAITGVL